MISKTRTGKYMKISVLDLILRIVTGFSGVIEKKTAKIRERQPVSRAEM